MSSELSWDTELPRLKKLTMLATSTQTPDQLEPEGWWCWLVTTISTNWKNVHKLITPCSLNTVRLLTAQPPGWNPEPWGHWPTVAPFAWQSNKAISFYFAPNCLWDLTWHWCTEVGFWRFNHGLNEPQRTDSAEKLRAAYSSRAVILNWEWLVPHPWDIFQRPETFLEVPLGVMPMTGLLESTG